MSDFEPKSPRERRRKSAYTHTVEVPDTYDPSKDSLAKTLLQKAGLPVGNYQPGEAEPAPVVLDNKKRQRMRGRGFGLY